MITFFREHSISILIHTMQAELLAKHYRDLLIFIWLKHLKSKKENNKIMYTFILFPLEAKYDMGLF